MNPDEEAFIRRFVVRDKRERWLTLLGQAKSRRKLTQRLYHHTASDFDSKYVTELEGLGADGALAQLRALGARDDCAVIATGDDDGTRQPLEQALERHYSLNDGTVLICVPDRLAFVEAEDRRFILRSP